jgi:hypothetical protein
MPDVMRRLPQPFPDRQMPMPPFQQGTPEQRAEVGRYQQANYPIGLGGYIGQPMGPQFGQGPQFGGPDPRLMPNVGFGNNPRPNGPSDPNEFWQGKDRGWLRFESLSDIQSKWKDIPQDQKNDIASRFPNPPEWMVGVSSPDRRLTPIPSLPSTEPMINPEVIKKAREEYLASLPNDRGRAVMTETKYGGTFGSSIGSGFDKWFEQNYINNPKSSLSEQERMSLQGRMKIPELGGMGSQIRADINARNGSMAGPQFGLGQIPNAGFGGNPQFGGPQFGGPRLGEYKLGYLGSETQLGMGPQFGGPQMPNGGLGIQSQFGVIGSGMQDLMGSGQQDEMRKKMMESMLAYNKQSQGNMMGGFGQPM